MRKIKSGSHFPKILQSALRCKRHYAFCCPNKKVSNTRPVIPSGILLNEDGVTPVLDENGDYIYL